MTGFAARLACSPQSVMEVYTVWPMKPYTKMARRISEGSSIRKAAS